jgi:glycosyltransferase involved in cell wall biosynthesis
MLISIVVPAHNEEENIVATVKKIESTISLEHELIVVNDHSTDRTGLLLEGLCKEYANLVLVNNGLKGGFANALKSGFAISKGEVVVPVMGDLCDSLDAIRTMAVKIAEGYDLVCASRYIKGGLRIGGSRLKGILSSFAGWSLYYLLGVPTHDIANAYKMYRKKVLDSFDMEAKGFEISMELTLKAYYAGFSITEVPTVWHERERGKSSFRMLKAVPDYLKFYLWGIKQRILRRGLKANKTGRV